MSLSTEDPHLDGDCSVGAVQPPLPAQGRADVTHGLKSMKVLRINEFKESV